MDKYFLGKNLATLCFLIISIILMQIEIPGLHEVFLLLEAVLIAFLVFDLDAPKRIGGLGDIPILRIYFAAFGCVFFLASPSDILGIAVVILVIAGVLIFPLLFWKRVRWKKRRGSVQRTYEYLLRKEVQKDPEFERKRMRLYKKFEIAAIDYLKILAFVVHFLKTCFVVLLLSLFIAAIGYSYVMELGLFALFALWAFWSSWDLLLKRKFEKFLEEREKLEETTWMLSAMQFLSPRGVLYLSLFIPSVLLSIILIVIGAQLGIFLFSFMFEHSMESLVLMTSVVVALFFLNLSINLAYVFYIVMKLLTATVYRKKRAGYRKDINLLPSARLCLIASLCFSTILVLPEEILGISLFGLTSLGIISIAVASVFSTIVWGRVILLVRQNNKCKMNRTLENHLALETTIVLLPIWARMFLFLTLELAFAFVLFLLLLVLVGDVFSAITGSKQQRRRVGIENLIFCVLFSVFLYLFTPGSKWAISLCVLWIFVSVILLLPNRFADLIMNHIFLIEEIETTNSPLKQSL